MTNDRHVPHRAIAGRRPQCAEPAVQLCAECDADEGVAFLCNACAAQHECGEEMLRPVVNSPRMGVCGYSGPGA